MKYRDITVFIGDHLSNDVLVRTAAELAAWQSAYLIAIMTSLPPQYQGDIGAVESYARGTGIDDFISHYTEKSDEVRQRNVALLEKHAKDTFLGLEWRKLPAHATIQDAMLHCRYTDLVLAAQPLSSHSADEALGWSSDELILSSGVPCLFVPESHGLDNIAETVVIGWNASREARRAVADAMPFLVAAREVVVLIVNPQIGNEGHGDEPGSDIGRYLSHHGVSARIEVQHVPGTIRSAIILQRCRELEASLLIIGAYGQPHLRNFFAGSATERILREARLPVLCSH